MKFKALSMNDDEKHSHHFDLPLLSQQFLAQQFLAPGELGVLELSVSKLVSM